MGGISLFKKSLYLKGALYALTGAILFSTKAIFVKLAYDYDVDTVSLQMLRMLFSLPAFLIIGVYSIRKDKSRFNVAKSNIKQIFILGLLGYYIASYLDLEGLQNIDASLERVILFIYPTIVLLLSYFFLKEEITKVQIFAITLSYIGILIAFVGNLSINNTSATYKGAAFVLASAFMYSIYLVGSGTMANKIGTKIYNSLAMVVASLAIIIHNLIINGMNFFSFDMPVYIYSLLISFVSTVIPSYLIVEGIRIIGANNSSIIGTIGPVSTIVLAIVFLGERLSLVQGIGSFIVILGVLVIMLMKPNK